MRPHITVCVCTFRRPALLNRLLEKLSVQATQNLFTYSIVIVDNDRAQSAQSIVGSFALASEVKVIYCVEAEQNIALARNQALRNAEGDFIAFIDDDEFPVGDWLWNLFKACEMCGVDGVLGPVKPYFESEPPHWVAKGRFFERPEYPTGYKMAWHESRTGNVLFARRILDGVDTPFRPHFATAGEDMDFFRRMIDRGFTFAWCNEAVAYESVPASRCTRSYLLRRALLRGSNFRKHPTDRLKNAVKSLIAVPVYILILPVVALLGQHLFVRYLIKLFDHASRLLAFMGLALVTQRET